VIVSGEWWAGDLYWWNRLVFEADGTGTWFDGDRKGAGRTVPFRWGTHGSTMTIEDRDGSRNVEFTLEHVDGESHELRFDREPFASAYLSYSNQERCE